MFDLVVSGGTIVTEEGPYVADIGIKDGLVAAIQTPDTGVMLTGGAVINAAGKYVLPGAIDCHVHFRQPGSEYKEDWQTGSLAAAFGGVTTVIEMPNTNPPTDSVERFVAKKQIAERLSYVDFGLYGLVAESSIDRLADLRDAGVVGFKCFLSTALSSHIPVIGDGVLLEAFEEIARLGCRCVIHAENASIIERRTTRLREKGRTDPLAHAESRPVVAALEAVTRVLTLAQWTGAPIHIAHESTAAAVELIAGAKARGVDVTVETCPQYLLLSEEDLARHGGIMRCNPPLRSRQNQEGLWRALHSGDIDILATDHAPHAPSEKASGSIWECQCGMLGVETAVPLMLTEVWRGRLSLSDYVRVAATNPAKVWGLYPRKGTIMVGSDADIVIIDPNAERVIDQAQLHSKSKSSPWHGWPVRGLPVSTLVRGRPVIENGEILGEPGWGRYVTKFSSTATAPTLMPLRSSGRHRAH